MGVLLFPLAGFSQTPAAAPGEILVLFKSRVSAEDAAKEAQRLGLTGQPVRSLQSGLIRQEGLFSASRIEQLQAERIKIPQGMTQEDAMARLQKSPLVRACSLNHYRHAHAPLAKPNDFYYQQGYQWWLQDVGADRVIAENILPSGSPMTIAILDTGTDLNHPDLIDKLVPGMTFTPGGGVGDETSLQHGTHTAGIAAASTNNFTGIAGTAGVAWIKIMPVKVLYDSGNGEASGYDYDISRGMVWAVDNGARVLNLSLGGPYDDPVEDEAVQYAYNHRCVVVASAGNDGLDTNLVSYPASYSHVIAVAACDTTGARSLYSTYNDNVDIAAPGGYYISTTATTILSTIPHTYPPGYGVMQGTSMAAPIVSGAAAMLLSQNPNLSPEDVENILETTAEKTGSLKDSGRNWDNQLGWGRVNVYRALTRGKNSVFSPASSSGRLSYNFPNPFNPARGEITNIVIPLAASDLPSAVRIRIYDAAGHLAKTLTLNASELWPGRAVPWDGRNEKGDRVANGVYPYALELNGTTYTNKIAVNNQ
jgi:subtilisin family serine protease